MTADACCICSALLDTYDAKTEKPIIPDRHLACCARIICTRCINQNPRYRTYCPYCQISTEKSALPQGLRDPPAYDAGSSSTIKFKEKDHDYQADGVDNPPAYSEHTEVQPLDEKSFQDEPAPDVLHFLTPDDTLQSLSLAYGVPLNALRKTNNVYSDHLIRGRKTILIPGEFYKGGISLSPQPLDSEEEELRKNKIRRFMVATKSPEYDVAVLYLEQSDYELESAIQAYRDDEQWEKAHPLESIPKKSKTAKSIGMRRFVGKGSSRTTSNTAGAHQ
ncbi:hypothetical protein K461DRAFT_323194 [Myriangium duriaei CBS 260.36]|uniref:LysM domain-containing protein n=1 Tax=Myriangium duriaei CBS 260.36 TaxID=1168546 RepID=A0A9P4IXT5_9PEZI|nr:hypothetical protein K461DRAFT_323194 [Myriangium duriaei CBS 260.36]